ncbi:hypothetical protein DAI22_08g163200 [Oryza sativa Japonica Group]|nr:hypothetical protein DAI22_08g163200 [Oryza sativa Japonica Group]
MYPSFANQTWLFFCTSIILVDLYNEIDDQPSAFKTIFFKDVDSLLNKSYRLGCPSKCVGLWTTANHVRGTLFRSVPCFPAKPMRTFWLCVGSLARLVGWLTQQHIHGTPSDGVRASPYTRTRRCRRSPLPLRLSELLLLLLFPLRQRGLTASPPGNTQQQQQRNASSLS